MTDTLTFEGRLEIADSFRHIPHSFTVPDGTRAIHLSYEIDPAHPGVGPLPHQVSLSVHDPETGRGAQHNLKGPTEARKTIAETWASPGYTPGPIQPGEWTVQVDVFRILPPGGVRYRLVVTLSDTPAEGPGLPPAAAVPDRGPGWYRGDLHGHTDHSDGSWGVADFVAYQRARGLDFAFLTDHNTVSGLPHARALAGDGFLIAPGVEVTTFWGHALALGGDTWIDWSTREGETMAGRAEAIMEAGHTFVIAHPMAPGHPWCSGCQWQYADTYPGPARLVEVWNSDWGPQSSKNELGLRLFCQWLNKGVRMRATAASDTHGPFGEDARLGHVRVRAEAFTPAAILDGLRAGRALLTSGPILSITATSGGREAGMGEVLGADAARVDLGWSDVPEGATLSLTCGERGGTGTRAAFGRAVSGEGRVEVQLDALAGGAWCLAELRSADGRMLALTNPVFLSGEWH